MFNAPTPPLTPAIQNAVNEAFFTPGASDAQKRWSHSVVERQVQHMSLLLDDLLDISRITRGQLRLRRERCELAAVFNAAVESARPLIDRKSHTLEVELPPDDELLGTPPVSPALSARSGRSLRSVRSVTSDTAVGAEEKPGRLSRFGLGSLGLSRKGSQGSKEEEVDRKQRATSAEPALMSTPDEGMSASPSGSSTSWTAPWRRRAASPDDVSRSPRATSPLVGAVITAEPESEDEGQVFYDSEGYDDNDDVSELGEASDDEPFAFEPNADQTKRKGARPSEDEHDALELQQVLEQYTSKICDAARALPGADDLPEETFPVVGALLTNTFDGAAVLRAVLPQPEIEERRIALLTSLLDAIGPSG